EGAQAFEAGRYDAAKELMEKGSQMTAFRSKVSELQREWLTVFAAVKATRPTRRSRRVAERLKRGLRTPERDFRVPILESLVEFGGSASMAEVLEKVESKMSHRLNAYDRQPLASDPGQIRWRNTAQWARNSMVREGLLAADSPRGVWAITSAGRRWLAASAGRP
ncbi:MAG: winged helix-turn-helix domain-containing protein, partial [Clostridia bacterium]|nr:winged helix-turn-helix domain-containing protein [Clostridia bacterium]